MKIIVLSLLTLGVLFSGGIELNKVLPTVAITEDNGGYVNGGVFSTDDLRGKIHVLMYVDPDESDAGENLNDALKIAKEAYPEDTFKSVAVINMEATWLPNFAIRSKLRSKQEKFPGAAFVKDEASVFVKKLGLQNDAYEALILDAKGKVLRYVTAPFSEEEVKIFVDMVNKEVAKLK
ncbi:MAG: YtfJ family protein [Thiovulaceae bacterium]|nr:YtfJ family protein [Sulfurimonadaceae bacterium]